MWFTVLDNPDYAQYSNKPVIYVPLPQLSRYMNEHSEAINAYRTKGLENLHKESIGIMRHSSRVGSVQHTVTNVLDKLTIPVTYFSTQRSSIFPLKSKSTIKTYPFLNRKTYMTTMRNDCKITIDDAERYIGWSRFVMESAIEYIPCISSNFCGKILYPDLYVEHKDYKKQIKLCKKLLTDKDFYNKVVLQAHDKLSILTNDIFCDTIMKYIKELNVPNSTIDVRKELFNSILNIFLPFEKLPARPNDSGVIYDRLHGKMITQPEWDKFYGYFREYIDDENIYQSIIREVLDKQQNNRSSFIRVE
jgi:hypothetical protein